MEDFEIRLKCLELAKPQSDQTRVVLVAKEYYEWVLDNNKKSVNNSAIPTGVENGGATTAIKPTMGRDKR